jgi:RNA polymerase sigma-70 factor (ECF subfamily)
MTQDMAVSGTRDAPGWEALMAAAQDGNRLAYERLLREVTPLLRAIARRRIGNSADAEDAVQETLLAVHRQRHTYDPARPLRPWLVAICERHCVDHWRRTQRRQARLQPIDDLADSLSAPASDDLALAQVASAELRRAVEALPAAQRIALQLCKLHQHPVAEASALSGRPEGALKTATHRAIRTLRQRFGAVAA